MLSRQTTLEPTTRRQPYVTYVLMYSAVSGTRANSPSLSPMRDEAAEKNAGRVAPISVCAFSQRLSDRANPNLKLQYDFCRICFCRKCRHRRYLFIARSKNTTSSAPPVASFCRVFASGSFLFNKDIITGRGRGGVRGRRSGCRA